MASVIANGRVLRVPSNGQQRVAEEIITRLGLETLAPPESRASGSKGHLWEQAVLPIRLGGRPLWSPSTSGPVFYANQVVTLHDIGFVDVPQFYAPKFAQTYRQIVKRLVRRVRHIATVSEFSRQRIIAAYGVPEERVTTIYPGISNAFALQDAQAVGAVREKFGLGERPYLIAYSGNDPRKNTQGVLRAWHGLGARRGEGLLVLFGRSSNAAVFNRSGEPVPEAAVVRVGGVPDAVLAALYSGANGMVFPSFYEGFGLPIVEAAASGAPVITTGTGAMAEIAPKGTELIDPVDEGALSEAMARRLGHMPGQSEREELAAAAAVFSWDRAAQEYRALFGRVFG